MTQHALDRLRARFPDLDPEAALAEIHEALAEGRHYHLGTGITGHDHVAVRLRRGAFVFPVVAQDGNVVTVLTEGMTADLTDRRIILRAPTLPAGLHRIQPDWYHADPAEHPSLSSGVARTLISRSPLHAWHDSPRLNPYWTPTEKKVFDIGRAAHRQVLGAGDDWSEIPPDILARNGAASTKEAKAFIAECREQGITPLKVEEGEQIRTIASAVHSQLHRRQITLDPEHSEMTVLAEIDGIWCRAMIDNAPEDGPLYDLKTTTDAHPDACMRATLNYGYDIQVAHYLDAWKAATGEDRGFRVVFVEKEPPYEVSVIELDPETLAMARRKIAYARQRWRECLEADDWPGYPPEIHEISLPAWVHEKWLDREMAEEERRRKPTQAALDAARAAQAPTERRDADA